MEESVKELVRKLCGCILDAAFHSVSHRDAFLASIQPPSKKDASRSLRKEREVRALIFLAYDVLLLRKWTWFGSWGATPLSPLCWCVAYGYKYHVRGRELEGGRFNRALRIFSDDSKLISPHTHIDTGAPTSRLWFAGEGGHPPVPSPPVRRPGQAASTASRGHHCTSWHLSLSKC